MKKFSESSKKAGVMQKKNEHRLSKSNTHGQLVISWLVDNYQIIKYLVINLAYRIFVFLCCETNKVFLVQFFIFHSQIAYDDFM